VYEQYQRPSDAIGECDAEAVPGLAGIDFEILVAIHVSAYRVSRRNDVLDDEPADRIRECHVGMKAVGPHE
jgi:hypothetical protein